MTWEFTSPLTLLGEWRDRTDEAELHELLLLGFTVDLPFLEKTVIPTARALGARITVIGDAGQGLYDPVDVRMAGRSYFHGLVACRGSFHPKLALLIGAHEAAAAIGSGNPTMAGWGYNDELWTILRGHENDAPETFRELGRWLTALSGPVSVPQYAADLLQETAARLAEFRTSPYSARVLHNLHRGLLEQLPAGPVDELHLYAPFLDQNGRALARIIDRLAPSRLVLGVQERWSSYDGDAILRSLDGGPDTELRLLAEQRPRHGKLLEWRTGDRWTALTGSANLTAAALLNPTADGGNCEVGVLAPVPSPLMPKGTATPVTHLRGRRTVRPMEGRPGLLVLGALLTGAGLLQVTLAHPYDVAVAVEVSPDGSPGSWTRIGTVPAGRTAQEFAVPEFAGAVLRIVDPRTGGRAESPPSSSSTLHAARAARPTRTGPAFATATPKRTSSPTRRWAAASATTCSGSPTWSPSTAPRSPPGRPARADVGRPRPLRLVPGRMRADPGAAPHPETVRRDGGTRRRPGPALGTGRRRRHRRRRPGHPGRRPRGDRAPGDTARPQARVAAVGRPGRGTNRPPWAAAGTDDAAGPCGPAVRPTARPWSLGTRRRLLA
ncbi:hypothetical protein [Actinomadura madurae]|uniref:hypothetical protein n=1 Tax=Actinomadura madurae TaxID=1993 RepID=UPI0020D230F2|nr:hypothetical protein [Actinomadura madurae]MCQ0013785.1 hypothetical protein [Actinomadura madurae]